MIKGERFMGRRRKVWSSVALGILWGAFSLIGSGSALAGGYEPLPESPWMVYFGVFGGYHHATYQYEALYHNDGLPRNQLFKSEIWQYGALWGGHVGIQYHFIRPYYLGLNFAGMSNSRKAQFNGSVSLGAGSTTVPVIDTTLRLKYNLDLTGIFGIDITPALHLYLKGGGSYAKLVEDFAVLQATTSASISQQHQTHHGLWGVVLGAGLARDLCRWVSLFAEYDFYDYGNHTLNTANNISVDPVVAPPDVYTQEAKNIRAYTIRAGINVNFNL
ncbi:outer membrane protein [Coxiella burnetii]|uniref:outer membrane protein n=1 Tax=Coxiella burnetii TaxID=777 RepID=UPI00016313B7|nr:hypothetical protein [Coxiella burnetii]ACJ18015.1 hypothetical exported protein [Coxiella burnetii CbuG_Q212]ACJ20651.1 hypothetical exported protein [Coxiella burnetii CbuK_Q154]ATN66425.1 hypothetical protein AYM17_02850 [Coxiella burnetii]ATN86266.1 hypothetical protein AYO29_07350 [Coxiella burnetii str. Schperling]EAX33042.2 hypothetical protein A35_07555 [Coxiella burnetii 'MSU Goat Q177']